MAGCSVGTLSVTCGTPFTTGRTLGLGGIARPRFGLRLALLLRDPGMGGRSSGAGLDMVEGEGDGYRCSSCAERALRKELSRRILVWGWFLGAEVCLIDVIWGVGVQKGSIPWSWR
jgi:hypothetical protein